MENRIWIGVAETEEKNEQMEQAEADAYTIQ